MKKLQFLTFITCAWVLCPLKIQAQNTYALIVGISQYKEMPALQYADRDAIAFADFVKGQGVPDQNVSLFLNEDATRMNIVDELYRLSRTLKPQDRFYFYFGGHGDLEAKIGYENAMLLLHGSFKTGYFQGKEFLQLSELKTWLTALSKTQTQVIFIADACHSGGLIGGSEGQTKTQRALQESWANVTKILSSQANEFSLEGQQWGGGRGLFSFHLVNGLTGRADVNKNKLVSVKELDEYLRYHVRREASPNVQTPLVVGETTLALSKSSASGLAQLAVAEKRNFPVISSVNFKGGNPVEKLLAKLDTGIVELYKRFSKAVKERRLADHDNAQDNALLHFRAMAGRKIPDTLLNIMKRNLGAALMERELKIMTNFREKGSTLPTNLQESDLISAISDLEKISQLFGPDHYFSELLLARKMVLQSMLPLEHPGFEVPLEQANKIYKDYRNQVKNMLLRSLQIEPNMVSTYLLLAQSYNLQKLLDSTMYYLNQVTMHLPNHALAFTSAGIMYSQIPHKDAQGKLTPHPRAIEYLERAIQLDSTMMAPYLNLASIYDGFTTKNQYKDYVKLIPYVLKTLSFVEKPLAELLTLDLNAPVTKATFLDPSVKKRTFGSQLGHYIRLEYLYQEIGDSSKSRIFRNKWKQYLAAIGSANAYTNAAIHFFDLWQKTNQERFLQSAQELMNSSLQTSEVDFNRTAPEDIFYQKIIHWEKLKLLGILYRMGGRYPEAASYLQEASAYDFSNFPERKQFKFVGYLGTPREGRIFSSPGSVTKFAESEYFYRIEPNLEMFFLYLDQNQPEIALQWLEKALQLSVLEYGNYTSRKAFVDLVLATYKNLDVNAFNALYEKYFPKTDEKK